MNLNRLGFIILIKKSIFFSVIFSKREIVCKESSQIEHCKKVIDYRKTLTKYISVWIGIFNIY